MPENWIGHDPNSLRQVYSEKSNTEFNRTYSQVSGDGTTAYFQQDFITFIIFNICSEFQNYNIESLAHFYFFCLCNIKCLCTDQNEAIQPMYDQIGCRPWCVLSKPFLATMVLLGSVSTIEQLQSRHRAGLCWPPWPGRVFRIQKGVQDTKGFWGGSCPHFLYGLDPPLGLSSSHPFPCPSHLPPHPGKPLHWLVQKLTAGLSCSMFSEHWGPELTDTHLSASAASLAPLVKCLTSLLLHPAPAV